jgi:O-antigen/teichoic acid export membrane protein
LNAPAEYRAEQEYSAHSIARQSIRLLVGTLGAAAFVLLRLAEPLVRIGLATLGLLSILMALFFWLVSSPPRSPVWLLLGFGFSCGALLLVYEWMLRALSGPRPDRR